ncbi:MAG: hypothetical protein ACXVRQ_12675, partial [Gaiellaceae bacterium]
MAEPERIRTEQDLAALDAQALRERFGPMLRRARLTGSPEIRRRHEENLSLAIIELATQWADGPFIDGRAVDLQEFLWVRLPSRLRQLDAEQAPEEYDVHRRSRAHEDFEGPPRPVLLTELGEDVPTPGQPLAGFLQAMRDAGITSVPSQLAALHMLAAVQEDPDLSGRQTAKALGHPNYKTSPASQALAAALDLVKAYEDAG